MSRDISIYTKRESPIEAHEILPRLRAEGRGAEWRRHAIFDTPEAVTVFGIEIAAEILPAGSTDPGDVIEFFSEAFTDEGERSNILQVYARDMTDLHRKVVLAARRKYKLSTGWLPDPRRGALLEALAAHLAEVGDGVLVDTLTNLFYTAPEYRATGPGRAAPPASA
jgi:hypothetical protein